MSLLLIDSFASYTNSADLVNGGNWNMLSSSANMTLSAGAGKFGTPALVCSFGNAVLYREFGSTASRRIGFYFRPGTSSFGGTLAFLANSSSTTGAATNKFLSWDSDNFRLRLHNGAQWITNWVQQEAAGSTIPGVTYWIELELTPGGMTLYKDGLISLTYTGPITLGTGIAFVGHGFTGAFSVFISHLVIWDGLGGGLTTFPIGPQRIQLLRPVSAGDAAEWTPNSGANWQAVDSTGWGGGVGVQTTATGKIDLHNMTDMAWNPWRINGLRTAVRAVDVNAGGSKIKLLTKDGGVLQKSADIALPITNPVTVQNVFDNNAAGNPWTKPDVDSIQVGYESVI